MTRINLPSVPSVIPVMVISLEPVKLKSEPAPKLKLFCVPVAVRSVPFGRMRFPDTVELPATERDLPLLILIFPLVLISNAPV